MIQVQRGKNATTTEYVIREMQTMAATCPREAYRTRICAENEGGRVKLLAPPRATPGRRVRGRAAA